MTVKGGTSQACAACKYQRRKCASDCQLAPYFPPDQPKRFQNAHKLFGVSNILKILKHLNQSQKMEAMRSIVFQADIRDKFPVHGCYGFILQLQHQLQQAQLELDAVNTQLAICRQQQQEQEQQQQSPSNVLPLFQNHHHPPFSPVYNATAYIESPSRDNLMNPLWLQHSYDNNQSQLVSSHSLPYEQQGAEVPQDYDEMPSFFDTLDDRQSYLDSKDAYDESSPESSLKDTTQSIQHVPENELNTAAACFSLTSVN